MKSFTVVWLLLLTWDYGFARVNRTSIQSPSLYSEPVKMESRSSALQFAYLEPDRNRNRKGTWISFESDESHPTPQFQYPSTCNPLNDGAMVRRKKASPQFPDQDIPGLVSAVGGITAPIGQFPYIALIGNDDTFFFCGGALFTNQHVLTAAHCVNETNRYIVRLGEHDQDKFDDGNHQDIPVATVHVHPYYIKTRFTVMNDIAILKLEWPANVNHRVSPVCLPDPASVENLVGKKVTAAGWGALSFGGILPSELQFVDLFVQPQDQCASIYKTIRVEVGIDVICASDSGKDACSGDSGGPLIRTDDNDNSYLVGIVSFGYKCAEPKFPGVFVRVSCYLNWIRSNTL